MSAGSRRSLGDYGSPHRGLSLVMWVVALVVALAVGAWQHLNDTNVPHVGETTVAEESIAYRFVRTGAAGEPLRVTLTAPDVLSGNLRWRPVPGEQAFESSTMLRDGTDLVAFLPAQPPGSRLEYSLVLAGPTGLTWVPDDGAVEVQLRHPVPGVLMAVHIGLLLLAVLFGVRAGLGAVVASSDVGWLSPATLGLVTLGGMILGPVVSTMAVDSFWTGWPLGDDWGANGAVIMWLLWIVAVLSVRSVGDPTDRFARTTVMGAALVTIAVSLVPRALPGL